jgi:L-threonylcarbamoyladenylate synthase
MEFEDDIIKCIAVLKAGGLILYPTDTVWGIGCDATNENAVSRIYELKKRSDEKAMIVLVAGEREIMQHVAAPDPSIFIYLENNPAPTTVIYEHALGLADNLMGSDGSIGIRICQDTFCRHLLKRFRKPIVSTSANISGQPTPMTFSGIDPVIRSGVDYIVNFRRDDDREVSPSAIIRWKEGTPVIIRAAKR